MLEDHADVLPGFAQLFFAEGGHFLAVHENFAAGGALQHVDAAHQGGFAGTGQADDDGDFAFVDGQVDIL